MAKTNGPGATASIPLDAITADVAAWSDEIVKAVTDEVLKEARKNAGTAFTSRSGNLYKSIKTAKSKFNPGSLLVKATDPKAHLIEHGHQVKISKEGAVIGHAAAHPFLGPAADAVRARLPEIVNNVVGALTIEVKK